MQIVVGRFAVPVVAVQRVGLYQIRNYFLNEIIGEPGVIRLHSGVFVRGLFHQIQRRGPRRLRFSLRDIALLLHEQDDVVAALQMLLRVGIGVEARRVLCDGRNAGRLGDGDVRRRFTEVLVRARLHARGIARQADGVQVRFQNLFLAETVVQRDGAEDLLDLTGVALDAGGFILAGDVFDELLFNGGRTQLAARQVAARQLAEHLVDGRQHRALKAEARMRVKILVLHRDERVLDIRGYFIQRLPDAVFLRALQTLVLHPLGLALVVDLLAVNDRGIRQLKLRQVQQVAVALRLFHHIQADSHCRDGAQNDAHTQAACNKAHDRAQYSARRHFFLFVPARAAGALCAPGRALRRALRAVFIVFYDESPPKSTSRAPHAQRRGKLYVPAWCLRHSSIPHFRLPDIRPYRNRTNCLCPYCGREVIAMSAKRIAVLVIVPIAVFAVSVGLFLLLAHPGRAGAAEPPSYTLGEDSGKLALFKTGENTPVTRYEIYTGLLPEQDVAALQQGIPVATQKELRRYLEDFGA